MNHYIHKDTYRKLYARYLPPHGRSETEMVDLAGDFKGKVVLDLCGGAGAIALECVERHAKTVALLDGCVAMVDVATLERKGVRVWVADVDEFLRIPAPDRWLFDVVFCRQAVNYWFDEETIEGLAAKIAPDGIFIFNTFNRKPPERPVVKQYSLSDGDGTHHFVEVHWCVDGIVHHVQVCEGMEPHCTAFRWSSPERFREVLEPCFDLDVRTDGPTYIYVCRKSAEKS